MVPLLRRPDPALDEKGEDVFLITSVDIGCRRSVIDAAHAAPATRVTTSRERKPRDSIAPGATPGAHRNRRSGGSPTEKVSNRATPIAGLWPGPAL